MALAPHLITAGQSVRARRLRLCALGPSACSQLLARARIFVCTILGLAPSADAHDLRALPCTVIGPSPAAPAASNCAGHAHAKRLH